MERFWNHHKPWLLSTIAFILGMTIFYTTSSGQAILTASVDRQLPVYCVQKESKVISLTFDAAWGNT